MSSSLSFIALRLKAAMSSNPQEPSPAAFFPTDERLAPIATGAEAALKLLRKAWLAMALLLTPLGLKATPSIELPHDGVAPGHDLTVPVVFRAEEDLASVQCDVLFDGARLSCTSEVALVSGPADVCITGSQIQPGQLRLEAYSQLGLPFSEDVVCNLTFSAPPGAANGQVTLRAGATRFQDSMAMDIPGTTTPGLILVGDAFGFLPDGGRAQFCGITGSNYVIETSEDLLAWKPLAVNTASEGLVWAVDAEVQPQRFYRAVPEHPPGLGEWIQVDCPTTETLAGVTFGKGIAVAVGGHGTAVYSLDGGSNWLATSVGTQEALYDVAFGNGGFVACGYEGGIYRSTNAVDWTEVHTLPYAMYDVAFANGRFMAVGFLPDDYYNEGVIASSGDGLTWTDYSTNWSLLCVTPGASDFTVGGTAEYALLFESGAGLIFDPSNRSQPTNCLILGPPGWTPVALAYGNGVYVGAEGASPGMLLYPSADGLLPFPDPEPEGCYWGVAFGFGAFVAVGENGTIINSKDGQRWGSNQTPTVQTLRDIGTTDRRFIAVGDEGTILLSPMQVTP